MNEYVEIEKEGNVLALLIYDLKNGVTISKRLNNEYVILIDSYHLNDKEIMEIQEKIIEYYKKRGAIIIYKHRTMPNDETVIYGIIEILDIKTGNLFWVMVR